MAFLPRSCRPRAPLQPPPAASPIPFSSYRPCAYLLLSPVSFSMLGRFIFLSCVVACLSYHLLLSFSIIFPSLSFLSSSTAFFSYYLSFRVLPIIYCLFLLLSFLPYSSFYFPFPVSPIIFYCMSSIICDISSYHYFSHALFLLLSVFPIYPIVSVFFPSSMLCYSVVLLVPSLSFSLFIVSSVLFLTLCYSFCFILYFFLSFSSHT